MEGSFVLNTLSDKDHHSAMAIIEQLGSCQKLDDLNHLLKSAIIPLIGCSGTFYRKLHGEQYTPHLLDTYNSLPLCHCRWKNFLDIATHSHLIEDMLTDDRIPPLATKTYCSIGKSCSVCPLYSSTFSEFAHRCCSIVILFDSQHPTIAIYFFRFTAQTQYYNMRDIKLLQLLRATLLQTIKAIFYKEECHILQHLLNCLPDHAEPLAFIRENGTLVYRNQTFDQNAEHAIFPYILTLLAKISTEKPYCSALPGFVTRIGRRSYCVTLSLASDGMTDKTRLYLLRFSRVSDKKQLINRQLSKAGLTHRELEIAALLHQSLSTRSISEQLNLSYHTVRNHIKHIYSKLGVNTRSEMMTWVEKSHSTGEVSR
jgi:DNA-binding CsgD family transcriptional regulator